MTAHVTKLVEHSCSKHRWIANVVIIWFSVLNFSTLPIATFGRSTNYGLLKFIRIAHGNRII